SLNDVTVTVNVFAVALQHGTVPEVCCMHWFVIAVPFWKMRTNASRIDVPSISPGVASASGQLNVSVTGTLKVMPSGNSFADEYSWVPLVAVPSWNSLV